LLRFRSAKVSKIKEKSAAREKGRSVKVPKIKGKNASGEKRRSVKVLKVAMWRVIARYTPLLTFRRRSWSVGFSVRNPIMSVARRGVTGCCARPFCDRGFGAEHLKMCYIYLTATKLHIYCNSLLLVLK